MAAAAGFATRRGRDADSVLDLWERSAPVPPQDSLDLGLVDLAAQSVLDLLSQLDGMEVETSAGRQTLVTEGDPEEFGLRFSELGPIDRTLHAVVAPTASYVLLVLGLWAIAFEIVQPGVGLAAVVGVVFLALAGYSLMILNPRWAAVALLVAGVALMTLDVRLRKLALPTVFGAVAFGAGSLLIYGRADARIDVSGWVIWPFVVATVLYFGFVLTVAVRSRERAIAATGSGLVGLVGESASDLAPEGQVVVKGAMWQARALGDAIPGGSRVRVRNVDGLVLEVTAESAPQS
jgi:membrane-bound serine protease (ClpP class)